MGGGVRASTASTPFFRSASKYGCSFAQTALVRCDAPVRKSSLPVYGVTFRTMKSRTSIEVCQGPGRNPLQLSALSCSILSAAPDFMVDLLSACVLGHLILRSATALRVI